MSTRCSTLPSIPCGLTTAMTGRRRAKRDGNPKAQLLGAPVDCKVGQPRAMDDGFHCVVLPRKLAVRRARRRNAPLMQAVSTSANDP